MKLNENIKIDDNKGTQKESVYLIDMNKKKCRKILENPELNENDIIEFLKSLHLVLEVSLTALYRQLQLRTQKYYEDKCEIMDNLDQKKLIDKTSKFLSNSKFDFKKNIEEDETAQSHKILDKIIDFSRIRHQLIYGYTSGTIRKGIHKRNLIRNKKLSVNELKKQIKKFRIILESMRLYLDCLDSSLSTDGKEHYKQDYLTDDFLPDIDEIQ